MLQIDLYVDRELASTYSCDGLIISTPVGSTAHNLSAGGPILHRSLQAVVISPICPHTLTLRPVVDSADRIFDMVVRQGNDTTSAVVDGRPLCTLSEGDQYRIGRAPVSFKMISIPVRTNTRRCVTSWAGVETREKKTTNSLRSTNPTFRQEAGLMRRLPRLLSWGFVSLLPCPWQRRRSSVSSKGGSSKPTTRTAARPNAKPANPAPKAATPTPAPDNAPKGTSVLEPKEGSASTASKPPAGSIVLRHKLKAGETLRTRTTHVANTINARARHRRYQRRQVGQRESMGSQIGRSRWQDHFRVSLGCSRHVAETGRQTEITYNSRTDEKPPQIFSRVAETVSKPIGTITIDNTGSVIERENQAKGTAFEMGAWAS